MLASLVSLLPQGPTVERAGSGASDAAGAKVFDTGDIEEWTWGDGQRFLGLMSQLPGLPSLMMALLAASGGCDNKKQCEWIKPWGVLFTC